MASGRTNARLMSIAAANGEADQPPAALMLGAAKPASAPRFVPDPGRMRRRRGLQERFTLAADELGKGITHFLPPGA